MQRTKWHYHRGDIAPADLKMEMLEDLEPAHRPRVQAGGQRSKPGISWACEHGRHSNNCSKAACTCQCHVRIGGM